MFVAGCKNNMIDSDTIKTSQGWSASLREKQLPKRSLPKKRTILSLLAAWSLALLFISCENSMEVIRNMTKTQNYPTVSRDNTEIFYSDSGRVKIRVYATRLERYTQTEDPYILFPEGILVYFYDSTMRVQTEISAKWAKYMEKSKIWEATNDVICRNNFKGEQLNTEELFWDTEKHKIYSSKFTRIQTADAVFIGDGGFDANQNFTWWQLRSTRGTVKLKDEP